MVNNGVLVFVIILFLRDDQGKCWFLFLLLKLFGKPFSVTLSSSMFSVLDKRGHVCLLPFF